MPLSVTQTTLVRIVAGQAITNNLLRLLALSPSVSISGSVAAADLADGAVTAAKATPGAYFYAADVTNTNTYAATFNPAVGSYADGLQVFVKIANTNTNALAATLNANGLGAKLIYHRNGFAVATGDLRANSILHLVYNSSLNGWQLQNVVPSQDVRFGTGGGTANVQTFTSSNMPAINVLVGLSLQLLVYKATVANTAAMTLNVDGTGAKPVRLRDNVALLGDEIKVNDTVILTYDQTLDVFLLLNRQQNHAIVGASRNLLAFNNVATPNSKVDITADEVILKTTGGLPYMAPTVSLTVDITASGANGLDTGAEAANTWYYLWLIFNGNQVATLLSLSTTAPTMPSGYTYKALVGAIRNDAGSNFVAFVQHDRMIWMTEQVVLTDKAVGVNDTWEILGGADLTAFRAAIPPIARRCGGIFGSGNVSDLAAAMLAAVKEDGSLAATIIGPQLVNVPLIATTYDNFGCAIPFADLPVRGGASYNIQWKSRTTALTVSLSICNYTF